MSDATLMTPTAAAADPAAPAAASSTADPAAAPAQADPAAPSGAAATEDPAAPKAEGDKPAAKEGDTPDESKPEGEKAPGAPEAYEPFVVPEGIELDAELTTEFQGIAKELNLPQEAAQKVVELGIKLVEKAAAQHEAALGDVRQLWVDQSRKDPEFGGEKLEATLAVAHKAREAFASPALVTLLQESGLGNHPEIIRLFAKVGSSISEDTLVVGDNGTGSSATAEDKFYPSMRDKKRA
jgi:hypothetical protein